MLLLHTLQVSFLLLTLVNIITLSSDLANQIVELAGCDLLTISPELLEQLAASNATVERKLSVEQAQAGNIARIAADEAAFRWQLNEDAMATEKLSEGIRLFAADAVKLEKLVAELAA